MRSYARYYLETFRLQVIPTERILDEMHNDSPNVDAHHGVPEERPRRHLRAAAHGRLRAGGPLGDPRQGAGSFTTVAERLKPESVFERFLKFREGLGMEVLPTTGGPHPFGVMAQRLRAGKLVCLVADRDLSDTGVEVDFFGEKALLPAGPAALAVQTGAALMPVSCWFVGDDEWGAYIHDEIPVPADGDRKEKVAVMTQQLATVFEQGIREHPEDWHMLQTAVRRRPRPRAARRAAPAAADGNGNGNTRDGDARETVDP